MEEGMARCNQAIQIQNEKLYTDILAADLENPAKNHNYKIKTDSIRIISENIHNLIKIAIHENRSKTSLKKNSGSQLDSLLNLYKTHLNYFQLQDTILKNKSQCLKNYKLYNDSKLNKSELQVLENRIRVLDNYILSYVTARMEQPPFRPDKTEVAVIPKNKYLSSNDIYEADIYLLSFNSKALYSSVLIEGRNIEMIAGKAIYIDSATNKPGFIKKEGLFVFKRQGSDFSKEFPFSISYQIKEK
jgi:hypothetical protein